MKGRIALTLALSVSLAGQVVWAVDPLVSEAEAQAIEDLFEDVKSVAHEQYPNQRFNELELVILDTDKDYVERLAGRIYITTAFLSEINGLPSETRSQALTMSLARLVTGQFQRTDVVWAEDAAMHLSRDPRLQPEGRRWTAAALKRTIDALTGHSGLQSSALLREFFARARGYQYLQAPSSYPPGGKPILEILRASPSPWVSFNRLLVATQLSPETLKAELEVLWNYQKGAGFVPVKVHYAGNLYGLRHRVEERSLPYVSDVDISDPERLRTWVRHFSVFFEPNLKWLVNAKRFTVPQRHLLLELSHRGKVRTLSFQYYDSSKILKELARDHPGVVRTERTERDGPYGTSFSYYSLTERTPKGPRSRLLRFLAGVNRRLRGSASTELTLELSAIPRLERGRQELPESPGRSFERPVRRGRVGAIGLLDRIGSEAAIRKGSRAGKSGRRGR